MIEDFTKKEIDKISYQLLKSSKALDIFPTPVDDILKYSDFVVENKIDLSKIQPGFLESLKDKSLKTLQSGLSKINGIFDRTEKIIYIDIGLDKNLGRKNFVRLHEVGHGVLDWQNEVTLALDNDDTLSEDFVDQFESEANYFASVTLFQHDRFLAEAEKLQFGLSAVMALRQKFGASVHSTFRNYVLQSTKRCALLVLTPIDGASWNRAACEKRNLFYSKSFLKEFGEIHLPDEFGFKWNFIRDYKFKKKYHENGKISLSSAESENLIFNYHFFNNSYNVFIFLFPKGEKNRGKTKIVLQNL